MLDRVRVPSSETPKSGSHASRDTEFHDVQEVGDYPLRVVTCPDRTVQRVEVEVQTEASP